MSSQFVDMNADGHKDIVCGSFSGTPQIIMGGEEGFAEPQPMVDRNDETILISAFWNDETDEWDKTARSASEGHCTSSFPIDWDDDGDLDLLLGDYYGGRLFVRMNEGYAKEPKFAQENVAVEVAGKPVELKQGLAAPEVVDWDQDGLFDILLGGSKGGVYLLRNSGTKAAPKFAAMTTLIEPIEIAKGKYQPLVGAKDGEPTEPGTSFHLDACDYDGDGDTDLLVGARCTWMAEPVKELTAEESELLAAASKAQKESMAELQVVMDSVEDDPKARKELMKGDAYKEAFAKYAEAAKEVRKYKKDPTKSGDFVWLFRRK